jgi:hypothetical protein
VSVDDVGAELSAELFDFEICEGIVKGMRCADEVGGKDDVVAGGAGTFHESAFGAGGGAGEEDDFVAALVETFAGEEGVFLGAADDEAGDNVEDFHEGMIAFLARRGDPGRRRGGGGPTNFAELSRLEAVAISARIGDSLGRMPEWSNGADCKSVCRRFESGSGL